MLNQPGALEDLRPRLQFSANIALLTTDLSAFLSYHHDDLGLLSQEHSYLYKPDDSLFINTVIDILSVDGSHAKLMFVKKAVEQEGSAIS